MHMVNVMEAVKQEFILASAKHKPMNSHHEAKSVIEEEFDEYWDEVKLNPKKMTLEEQEQWRARLRNELVQTAAMCCRALADLC